MRYSGEISVITIIVTPKLRDTHQLVGHQIDDATQIEKTAYIIEKCKKLLWIHLNMEQEMLLYKTEAMCYNHKNHRTFFFLVVKGVLPPTA